MGKEHFNNEFLIQNVSFGACDGATQMWVEPNSPSNPYWNQSCTDDCGVVNGDNACLDVTLSLGDFDLSTNTLEILYGFNGPVAGFQFNVTGLSLTGADGGAAEG